MKKTLAALIAALFLLPFSAFAQSTTPVSQAQILALIAELTQEVQALEAQLAERGSSIGTTSLGTQTIGGSATTSVKCSDTPTVTYQGYISGAQTGSLNQASYSLQSYQTLQFKISAQSGCKTSTWGVGILGYGNPTTMYPSGTLMPESFTAAEYPYGITFVVSDGSTTASMTVTVQAISSVSKPAAGYDGV